MSREINIDECIEIGYVHKSHGLAGEVMVKFAPLYLPTFEELDQVFVLIEGSLVPYFVEDDQIRFRSNETANVKFLWIDSGDKAKELTGKKLFCFSDKVVIDEDEFDSEALISYQLVDPEKGEIGAVVEVNDYSGNLVVTVDYNGNEVMVPLADEILDGVDHDSRTISVNVPDGLLEMYD